VRAEIKKFRGSVHLFINCNIKITKKVYTCDQAKYDNIKCLGQAINMSMAYELNLY